MYVALALAIEATLLTSDRRLANQVSSLLDVSLAD
jgi:predicted nucleic acid-binding protein